MSKVYQKIEVTANILIIIVALLLGGFLVQRYFFPIAPAQPERKVPVVGQKISEMNIDWSKNPKNILLVLSRGCKFCTESAGFYKNLIEQSQGKNIRITAVLPQSKEEAEKYISELGISGIEIRQSQLDSLNVGGTPTIIVVNDKGEISDVWMGKIPPDKETEVLQKLNV